MSPQPGGDQGRRATVHAFLNPGAGGARDIEPALESDPRIALHRATPDRLAGEVRDALAAGATRIVVAGGDGTVRAAASVLAGTRVELAVLRGGTLNHFAKSVGVPDDPRAALEIACGTRVRPVDVGYVNDRLILNTSSVGVYTLFVRTRERYEARLGYRLASIVATVRLLSRLVTLTVEVEVGAERRAYRTPLVFVGIGERELRLPSLGARVESGRAGLHLIVVRGKARARLVAIALAAAARGTHHVARTPSVDSLLLDRCTVRLRAPRVLAAIDGEIVTLDTPLEYRIARGALHVVVPE